MAPAGGVAPVSTPQLLAIDVGTQSVRAIVFDAQGHLLAKAQQALDPPYVSPRPGWAEQDPACYWRAMVAACNDLWRQGGVRPESIGGLALTTLRSTVVCADDSGQVLRPAIVWLDQLLPTIADAAFHWRHSGDRAHGASSSLPAYARSVESKVHR